MKNPLTAEARRLAGLRLQGEYAKHSRGNAGTDGDHYNENQPRVPAGQPGGGQWTSGGGGGGAGGGDTSGVGEEEVPTRGGRNPLVDLLKEQAVDVPPDERVQQAAWPAIPPALAFAGRIGVGIAPWAQRAVGSALATYAAQLAIPQTGKLPALLFTARKFPGAEATVEHAEVRSLTKEETQALCSRLKDVQKFTDKAVKDLAGDREWRPVDFGTAVHLDVKDQIMKIHEKDQNFTAEESILKGLQETKERRLYGKPGSIRIDALQRIDNSTIVCVYDIKTGKSILTPGRIAEIASNVYKAFGNAKYFVVVEVKPTMR